MLKENQEQTDKDALAVIRTELSKRVPNLELVLSLANKSQTLKGYVEEHLEDLGYLDKLKEIDMELSKKETPEFAEIMEKFESNEALIAYYKHNETFNEICYKYGIQEIDKLIFGDVEEGFFGGQWEDAWDAVSYDSEGEIEYALEVRLRLAEHYIERLGDAYEDPMDVLEQLTDLEDGTRMQDLGDYRITILYKFLNKPLKHRLKDAIENLVDSRYEDLKSIEDWEDTKRSTWYY